MSRYTAGVECVWSTTIMQFSTWSASLSTPLKKYTPQVQPTAVVGSHE